MRMSRIRKIGILLLFLVTTSALIIPHQLLAEVFSTHMSGYLKSVNFFTKTSGFVPELVDSPFAEVEAKEKVFSALGRLRLKFLGSYQKDDGPRFVARIHSDHQSFFGTFTDSGDFRIMKKQSEQRQFLDLSQTYIEDDDVFFEHRFYRASLAIEWEGYDLEVGRQLIPWGVGHFFTPTDLFNPFNATQIELMERDGVDAVNFTAKNVKDLKMQFVYTPGGKQLHPQRYLTRFSRDVKGYELGLLGGRIRRDHAVGVDIQGNIKDVAVRGEMLYRESSLENDFVKFTINADYNFPHNVYGLLEYHHNGQGARSTKGYDRSRLIRGDIQQLAKNYLAASVGYDITPLLRIENRTIFNMDDQSVFDRPEIQYEMKENIMILAGAQLFMGDDDNEYGSPKNLFLMEAKYSF